MIKIYKISKGSPIDFAAEELKKYLSPSLRVLLMRGDVICAESGGGDDLIGGDKDNDELPGMGI